MKNRKQQHDITYIIVGEKYKNTQYQLLQKEEKKI